MNMVERSTKNVALEIFEQVNSPELVSELSLNPTIEQQYVLRCPLLIPDFGLAIPDELMWTLPLIERSMSHQEGVFKKKHPYMYITVRHGNVVSETDDLFHVDGFSMKVPHEPEQNYVWTSNDPTEVALFALNIPHDFDPLMHNIHLLIQDQLAKDVQIETLEEKTLYVMDPYVIHRRPKLDPHTVRTFVRLSMTSLPIDDVNNYINPAFGDITSGYDGVVDFRDKLLRYVL